MFPNRVKDRIIYDERNKEIIFWSLPDMNDNEFERQWDEMKDNEGYVKIDNLINKLYTAFKDVKDITDMKHIMSKYICLLVSSIKEDKSLGTLHYLCVVPREWDYNILEELLRPIFIQAGLISETDHNDRLLFISDTESIFYGAQTKKTHSIEFGPTYFKTGDRHILCRIDPLEDNTKVSIKFDLIEAHPSLFNIPQKLLYPRILKSSTCIMTETSIQSIILSTTLKPKLFQESNLKQTLGEYIYSSMEFVGVNKKGFEVY